MATSEQINIKHYAESTGIFEIRPLEPETIKKASELLQSNHENYHIYIHNLGLHSKLMIVSAHLTCGGSEASII